MGVDIATWRSRIGHFHLLLKHSRPRNKRQPLKVDQGSLLIPVITWLILALCFTSVNLQPNVGDQPWPTQQQAATTQAGSYGLHQCLQL